MSARRGVRVAAAGESAVGEPAAPYRVVAAVTIAESERALANGNGM